MSSSNRSPEDRLRVIAEILGIPVGSFLGGLPPRKLTDTVECMRLWERLRTDAGRGAALDALRKVLDEEDA